MADVQYEVEQIVGKRIINNRRVLYLVRWRGFSPDHDSWEPASNLHACRTLLSWYNNDSSNLVIRDDGDHENATKGPKAMNSPEKQSAKHNKNNSPKSPDKEKGQSKVDPHHGHKLTTSDVSIPDKGASSSKENTKKSSMSRQIQVDFHDKNGRGSPSSVKLPTNKTKSPDKLVNHANTPVNSVSHNHIKKTKLSYSLKDMNSSPSDTATKVSRKRKLEDDDKSAANGAENVCSHHGASVAKKQKVQPHKADESIAQDKATATVNEDIVDLTLSDDGSHEQVDEEDEDDENVLYSLNADCDHSSAGVVVDRGGEYKKGKESLKSKKNIDSSKNSVISKLSDKDSAEDDMTKSGGKKKNKRMSLMDSKKAGKTWTNKSDSVRSVTPPPYTSVKDVTSDPTNTDPSKPSGNSLPDPVSPEASETYLADVPSSFPVPAEEPLTEEPLSPSSLLYKSLLDSLPDQRRPLHKGNGKKSKGDVSRGKSLFGPSSGKGAVERRTSVRSTECAFRYKQIVVKKCARYTQIWLNTTTVMKNALNPVVIQEIISALNSAKYDDSRLVLFSGLGTVFCSGTDLHFLVSGDRPVAARQMAEKVRELTKTFITFPKPIIAAVSGAAVGMGVSLLTLCDVVYASDKASFYLPYSQLSQTPEGCSSFTLPLIVGLPAANELLYGGRKITAMEAYQLGLVSQVFWPTLMMQEIIPRVQNMAICSSKALEATKLLVRSHQRTKMELTNETECNLLLESWLSVDCQQSIETYISNEKNVWF